MELHINADDIESIAVAIDVYKRQRMTDAFRYNREGLTELSDKAWRDAARLDVYWHDLSRMLTKDDK